MSDHPKLIQLKEAIRAEFPDFRIVLKNDSRLMKAIDIFLKVITFGSMRVFMSAFITTIGNTVYVPKAWDKRAWQMQAIILRHERVHMRQSRRLGAVLYSFLYLFFPLPTVFAYYRKKFEQEAYAEGLQAAAEFFGLDSIRSQAARKETILHFTGPEYFWTWPWKKGLEKWYDEQVAEITQRLSS